MLCRIFFRFISKIKLKLLKLTSLKQAEEQIIKNKTEITEIDIAESKIQLLKNKSATEPKKRGIRLNSRAREKEPTEPKRGRSVRSPLKQCITADKPPYQRASSESRQAHSRHIPSFPIAIP